MEKRSLAVSLLGGTRERLLPGRYHAPNGEPLAQYRTRDEGVDGARSQHSCSRGHRPPWRRPRDPPEFRRACGASSVADRSARKGPRAPHDMTARTPGTCGGLPHEYVAVPAVVLTVRVREHTTPAIGGRDPNQEGSRFKPLPIVFGEERAATRCSCCGEAPFTRSCGVRTRAAAPRTIARAAFPPPKEKMPEELREERLAGRRGRGRASCTRGAIRSRTARATRTRGPCSRARAPSRSSVPLVAALAAVSAPPLLHSVIRHDA